MTRQLRYLIIGVTFIIGSCAPNKGLETQLMEAGQMTETACPGGGGVWEEIAENKYVFRCNADIPSGWTKATSPPPAPEPTPSISRYCKDPTSGVPVKNGASTKYPDGTRTCMNGKWSNPVQSGGSSGGGGSGGGSSGGRTLVSKTCTISTTGLTSDWNGAQYSWTIWNNWSDGSRSVASMGSGYSNVVPNGC